MFKLWTHTQDSPTMRVLLSTLARWWAPTPPTVPNLTKAALWSIAITTIPRKCWGQITSVLIYQKDVPHNLPCLSLPSCRNTSNPSSGHLSRQRQESAPHIKKKSRGDLQNYCPISLLSVGGKVFESIIAAKIAKFFDCHQLNFQQFGFDRGDPQQISFTRQRGTAPLTVVKTLSLSFLTSLLPRIGCGIKASPLRWEVCVTAATCYTSSKTTSTAGLCGDQWAHLYQTSPQDQHSQRKCTRTITMERLLQLSVMRIQ